MAELDLYYWPTPNGFKLAILLGELGVPYNLIPVDITKGEQFDEAFLAISPNNKIPALVDHAPDAAYGDEPLGIFESAAIMTYLAEKFGRFLPGDPRLRLECNEWLYWQMASLGPMAGQAHHFRLYAPDASEYAIDRYTNESARLYRVLEKRLSGRAYVCDEYSIADMAIVAWIFRHERHGQRLEDYPNIKAWYDMLMSRPAVAAGFNVAATLRNDAAFTSEVGREHLFGGGKSEQKDG